jgi:hypothetical protein
LHFSPRTFVDPGAPAGRGIGIAGGAFRGVVAFDEDGAARARAQLAAGTVEADGVLLVLENPIPDEIPMILSVDGLLAARGGSTSHAAVAVHGIDATSRSRPCSASAAARVVAQQAVLIGTRSERVRNYTAATCCRSTGRPAGFRRPVGAQRRRRRSFSGTARNRCRGRS